MHIQVSRLQLITMMVWTVLGTGVLAMPASIAQFTVQDAWAVGILFLLSGAVAACVATVFVRAFPDETLVGALCRTMGRPLGGGLALFYIVWLYIAIATIARELSGFVTASGLPKTPDYVVSALSMAVAGFLGYLGLEVLGRVNEFITPLAILVIPFLVGLSLRHFQFGHFLPVFGDGWSPVLRAAVVPNLVYAFELTLALQMIPSLRSPETLGRDILIAAALISGILTMTLVMTVGVEGPATSYLAFPILEVVRSIRIGRFIERVDTLYVMGVVSTLVLKLAVFLYGMCEGLRHLFKLTSLRLVSWSGAAASWAGSSFLFHNGAEVTYFIVDVAPVYITLTMVVLPLLAVCAHTLSPHKPRRKSQ